MNTILWLCWSWSVLYVHGNRRLIRDRSPGRPPPLSHSSWALLLLLLSLLLITFFLWHNSPELSYYYYYWSLFLWHNSLLSGRLIGLMSHVILTKCQYPFVPYCLISTEVMYWQRYLVVTWLVPPETAAASVHSLCSPYNHAPVYSITSFKVTSVGCLYVFSCNLPPALLAEWTRAFTFSCGNTKIEQLLK